MHLLYVDESGKSGLRDPRQPFYVLGGLAVSEEVCQAMEADLNARIDKLVPPPRSHEWELHMTHMVNGKGWFKAMSRDTREALCDAVLDVLDAHSPTLIFVAIDKQALLAKYARPDDPEEMAYRFMIERFEHYLRAHDALGMIMADRQKGAEDAIRRAHSSYRRSGTEYMAISRIIETPSFLPSHWSRHLQVVDVAAWLCNRALRTFAAGEGVSPQWERIVPHLDCYPFHKGKGLKVFPDVVGGRWGRPSGAAHERSPRAA